MSCLVTAIADDPEQKHARPRSVHPAVQGWPGPSATGRDNRQLTDLITLSDREVRGERAQCRRYARGSRWMKPACRCAPMERYGALLWSLGGIFSNPVSVRMPGTSAVGSRGETPQCGDSDLQV